MYSGKVIKNRLWIPKHFRNFIKDNFCEFKITNKRDQIGFISKINKDGRLVIPKSLGKLEDGTSNISFKIIKNSKRNKKLFRGKKLDILSLIPKKTLTRYDILVKPLGNKLFLWYFASRGRPKEVIVNRYPDISFYRLLGYYRAEGGKARLSIRRGREFSFTNKSLDIISDFISIFDSFCDKKLLKVSIRYNPKCYENLNKIVSKLVGLGIEPNSIRSGPADRIREFTVRLYVTNSLLSEVINNAENTLRKKLTSRQQNLVSEYLRGVIAGDGSFYSWTDKNGSTHSRLQIFEANEEAIKDLQKLLSYYNINGIYKKAKSNMYVYTSSINWNNLLKLYKFCLLKDNNKLKSVIKSHKRFRALKHMIELTQKFTASDFIRLTKKEYGYTATWLKDRQKEGYIKKGSKENNQNVWRITKEGGLLASLLRSLEN